MLAAVLLVLLAVGPVILAVALSRRPVVRARPAGMGEAAPSVMRTHGLSVTQFFEVEAAVQRVEPPRRELFPAAQQLARQQLEVPEPRLATVLARLQCALGAAALVVAIVTGSLFLAVYGTLYAVLGGFSLAVTMPRERRRRELVRQVFRTDEAPGGPSGP